MQLAPTTLTNRLIVTAVALVAVVSLLVTVVATIGMRTYMTSRLDDQLAASLDRAEHEVSRNPPGFGGYDDPNGLGVSGGGVNRCADKPNLAGGQPAGSFTAVNTESCDEGFIITAAGDPQNLSAPALTILRSVDPDQRPQTIDVADLGSFRVASTTIEGGGVVVQGLPTADVDEAISNLIWWEVLLGLLGTLAAAAAARSLVHRQLRPLQEVAATAHEVSSMSLTSGAVGTTARVPAELTDPHTEVGQVGAALNHMLSHVEGALDARHESELKLRQFLADASHELRTPLATIKGYAELTRRTGIVDPDQLVHSFSKVESEAARMSRLVEDMLLLARLDSGRPLDLRPVDLTQLLLEAVNDLRVVDPDRRWRIDVPDEPVVMSGDELRLHQAVTNLLTNASRHTPEGTTITSTLHSDPVRIVIADDGPGIDPVLAPVIFDRFSRGDSSRTRRSGGAGLGMSLVKAITEAHGGEVSLESKPGCTSFELKFR